MLRTIVIRRSLAAIGVGKVTPLTESGRSAGRVQSPSRLWGVVGGVVDESHFFHRHLGRGAILWLQPLQPPNPYRLRWRIMCTI